MFGWVPTHGAITGFVYLAQFLMASIATPATTGTVFDVFARFLVFAAIPDVPTWLAFILFIVLTLPWILLAAYYLFQLFNNVVTGAVLGVGLILAGAITAVIGFT